MTNEELNKALNILGPKIVNSLMRMSTKHLGDFEKQISELVESKIDKTKEWYKPGKWIEVT